MSADSGHQTDVPAPGQVLIPGEVLDLLTGKLGYADAVDRVGTTAAPLLAGFALTLVGLTVSSEDNVRWPAVALALLVIAVLLMIGAVQASFNARSWFIPLDQFLARLAATPERERRRVTGTYAQGLEKHAVWARRTRLLYNLGIFALLAGLVFVVTPKGPISNGRVAVIVLAGAGFAIEGIWWIATLPSKSAEPENI